MRTAGADMVNVDEFDYASEYAYGKHTGPYGPPLQITETLADLRGFSRTDLVDHVVRAYEVSREAVEKFDFIVAYESIGDYGCDSASLFVLRDRSAPFDYYTVRAGHCSCNGFEGQWEPEWVSLKYLKSSYFRPGLGEADDTAILDAVAALPWPATPPTVMPTPTPNTIIPTPVQREAVRQKKLEPLADPHIARILALMDNHTGKIDHWVLFPNVEFPVELQPILQRKFLDRGWALRFGTRTIEICEYTPDDDD